jgi:predicted enzyme related to lactoylglutathione lyase
MSVLETPDADAANQFYGRLFGWRPEPFGPATLWRLPGYVGGEPEQPVPRDVVAVMTPANGGSAPAWSVGFWVSDAQRAADIASERGGRVLAEPHEPGNGFRTAVLADPEGASFSVSQLLRA